MMRYICLIVAVLNATAIAVVPELTSCEIHEGVLSLVGVPAQWSYRSDGEEKFYQTSRTSPMFGSPGLPNLILCGYMLNSGKPVFLESFPDPVARNKMIVNAVDPARYFVFVGETGECLVVDCMENTDVVRVDLRFGAGPHIMWKNVVPPYGIHLVRRDRAVQGLWFDCYVSVGSLEPTGKASGEYTFRSGKLRENTKCGEYTAAGGTPVSVPRSGLREVGCKFDDGTVARYDSGEFVSVRSAHKASGSRVVAKMMEGNLDSRLLVNIAGKTSVIRVDVRTPEKRILFWKNKEPIHEKE